MIRMVIGIQTCERLKFTKETIESLIYFNPTVLEFPWVFSDDNSKDGTIEYLKELSIKNKMIVGSNNRIGLTKTYEQLVSAIDSSDDILLYLQNDWKCVRKINFDAILKLYEDASTGHIRTIVYKGNGIDMPACTSAEKPLNAVTRSFIKKGEPFKIGEEEFTPGEWHYSDIPGFIRLSIAKKMFKNMPNGKGKEGVRSLNVYKTGCKNYLLMNQPFRNLDPTGKQRTIGRII